MAYFEWDVSSITSSKTTLTFGAAGGVYYGTLFGAAKGYWVRLPSNAPAINDITLAAAMSPAGNDGLYMCRTTTILANGLTLGTLQQFPVTIIAFQRGGRWIKVANYAPHGAGCAVVGGKSSAGAGRKILKLYYKSVLEYVGPTNG